jgi:hypothetical protein
MAFNQRVNAEPSDRLMISIEKDVLGCSPSPNQFFELARCVWPQRTEALLIAFAVDLYE